MTEEIYQEYLKDPEDFLRRLLLSIVSQWNFPDHSMADQLQAIGMLIELDVK